MSFSVTLSENGKEYILGGNITVCESPLLVLHFLNPLWGRITRDAGKRGEKMRLLKISQSFLVTLLISLAIVACTPDGVEEECMFTANIAVTAYRLPDDSSDFFGILGPGDQYKAWARTSDGWVGFDPGYAQAGNIGLAHHRWVEDPISFTPSCIDNVDLVTMEEILTDLEASTGS